MQSNNRGSLQSTVIDEIALEGLEGVTLPSLWVYLGKTLNMELPLPTHFTEEIWQFILKVHQHLTFFEIPNDRETVVSFERYKIIDPDLGVPITPDVCPLMRYKFVPINEDNVMGSCECYKERQIIPYESIMNMNVEQILNKYGKKFVIVASQKVRYLALTPENVLRPKDITPVQYAIWEAVGRARHNGETTAGLWSLQNFLKDSPTIFYVKNRLLRYNVISSQLFNEKRGERLIVSTLLTLPRFHKPHRSTLMAIMEKMFLILKDQPDYRMPLNKMRTFFNFDSSKTLKKVMLTHLFRRIFETQSINYYDVYKKSKPKSRNPNGARRRVPVVVLKHPERSFEELFTDLENETVKSDGENIGDDFHNDKHAFVDMSFREEFYQCLLRHGSRGASQSDVYRYMSTNYLALRQLTKHMSAEGLINSYTLDFGRQRCQMYVALEYSDTVKKTFDCSMTTLKNLQCNNEPNIPKREVILSDTPQIVARVKPANIDEYITQREIHTQRLIARKAFIVQTIDENCIISSLALRKSMIAWEKSLGAKDEACRKTLRRVLSHMSKLKIINLYEIILQCDEQVRIHRYITHPKIDAEHEVLKYEILKLKGSFFLAMEEKRMRQLASSKCLKKQQTSCSKMQKNTIMNKSKELIVMKSPKAPKFLISRFIHEFLFYIIIDLSQHCITYDITPNLLKYWKECEPSLNINEYYAEYQKENVQLKAYTKELSWRTFIPPLPSYSDKPVGWAYFIDAIDRMPLSIFNKIFVLDQSVDERLTDYLYHPIRQHYLMRQLPTDLHCKIMRIQMQRVYISVLKLLNQMGLIQVSDRLTVKDPLVMWVYFNRIARILDTTTSDISYKHINTDREYAPIQFEFCSLDDVHRYWMTLQRICVHTKLGFLRGKRDVSFRPKQLEFLENVNFDDAPANDNSKIPGDGLGAAGLSSNLYAHIFRNWSWSIQTKNIKNKRTGRTIGSGMGSVSVRSSVKTIKIHRNRQGIQTCIRDPTTVTTHKKKKFLQDAIDRDALKNMRTLRVKWSSEEDDMLMIAKAVQIYLGDPVASFPLINICRICRDIIRHTLGVNNKTAQACIRRLQFLIREKRHIPRVPSWLHILKGDMFLQRKYHVNYLDILRKHHPERKDFSTALLKHFTTIMYRLYELVYNNDKVHSQLSMPNTLEEFNKNFMAHKPVDVDDEMIFHRNPETIFDIQVNTAINVLHSSLCSIRDKTLFNLQAFEIYKNFSENVLETAFAKARSDGMVIAVKRRNMNLLPTQMTGPQYILSSKYRGSLLWIRLPYSVYDAFYAFYDNILGYFYRSSSSFDVSANNYMELKSPTLGQLFVISECLKLKFLDTNIKLPINILTIDTEQNNTESSFDRTLVHFQNILQNAPETEYEKNADLTVNEKSVRVKFHPANISYKLHYTPYDFLAKLPQRYLHFFCAIKHINEEINIDFKDLYKVDKDGNITIQCPFSSCILIDDDNYLNAIERIVLDKQNIVNTLKEIHPQKLHNMAINGQLSVKIDHNNLLTMIRILESFWHEKESTYERKDLGKMFQDMQFTKPIDWSQLCSEIITFKNTENDYYDKTDEYEPTLNKEERITRAQDVFVVNLPTIQLKVNNKFKTTYQSKKIKYNGFDVPEILLSTNTEEVVQRIISESTWSYTDNDLNIALLRAREKAFNERQQQHLIDIHDYILSYTVGVAVVDLKHAFQNERYLFESIKILSELSIIKRVGINSFMYVHKNHIKPWVVHTFNLKRLDRENIGGSTATLQRQCIKQMNDSDKNVRKINNDDNANINDHEEPPTKVRVFEEEQITNTSTKRSQKNAPLQDSISSSTTTLKRIVKPVQRYNPEIVNFAPHVTPVSNFKERDLIVLRPVPWIRLNGSLNRRVLDRWMGSILNECVIKTGCKVSDICRKFPYMIPVDVMLLLEMLSHLKCIQLKQIECIIQMDLFTEYEPLKERVITEICDPDNTYVYTQSDAVMRLCLFMGNKKYNIEFI